MQSNTKEQRMHLDDNPSGSSVAVNDSAVVDTMKQSNLSQEMVNQLIKIFFNAFSIKIINVL